MKLRHSLRFRLIVTFCLFGALLSVVYGFTVLIMLESADDRMFREFLEEDLDAYLAKYQNDPETPLPASASPYTTSYLGSKTLPAPLSERLANVEDGYYEVGGEYGVHVLVHALPERAIRLFIVLDVASLEPLKRRDDAARIAFFVGGVLVTAVGGWLGWMTSRTVIAPVVNLARLVRSSGAEGPQYGFSQLFFPDEVGQLAKVLDNTLARLRGFVQRERRFTRDVSHELRTPVTVVKGALELLEHSSGEQNPLTAKPLQRISRAVSDMEKIIETFLWLGREPDGSDIQQATQVATVVEHALQQHSYLTEAKPVAVRLQCLASPCLQAPPQAFSIAVSNLVRNALQHTSQGEVRVIVSNDRVEVADTGPGIASDELAHVLEPHVRGADSSGHGLGLDIVQRLCERFDWRLELQSEVGVGTTARLVFVTAETATSSV